MNRLSSKVCDWTATIISYLIHMGPSFFATVSAESEHRVLDRLVSARQTDLSKKSPIKVFTEPLLVSQAIQVFLCFHLPFYIGELTLGQSELLHHMRIRESLNQHCLGYCQVSFSSCLFNVLHFRWSQLPAT
jgi:hypothetical protein